MKEVKISKVQYVDCLDMYENVYRVSIRVNFDGYYRSLNMNIAANDSDEAKEFMKNIMNKHITLVPDDHKDEAGFNTFCDAVIADVKADETQKKYIASEEEKKQRFQERMKELGY